MNKPIQEYLSHGLISFRILMLFALVAVLVSCAATPDFQRRYSANRETQMISAKRPLVASCISQQLKATTTDEVIESEESVVLMVGKFTLRVYDLEDGVGGTMVTFFGGSFLCMEEYRLVISNCRVKLESPKPPLKNPAN